MASLFISSFIVGRPASAIPIDFDAYLGATIQDSSIDGTIGTEWDDAGHYTNVPIDPPGSGVAEIWTKHDGTYLYMAVKFDADSVDSWLAIMLGSSSCMDTSADLALFGDNNQVPDGYSDANFDSGGSSAADAVQDGIGAMTVVPAGQIVTVELKKPLNSGDAAGKDINWLQGNAYTLTIAWDSNGGGSSGGNTNHRGGPTAYGILISPNPIPEFPGWMFIVVLLVLMVPVIVLARKMIPKLPTTRKL